NYGVELEARKTLGFLADPLHAITVFANATLMESQIDIGSESSGASKIGEQRPMVGQAPYVVNLGTPYASDNGSFSGTVLYNVVGKRIFSAAERPLPDVYEQPRHMVDVALRFPVVSTLSAKLDIKNALDAPYELTQGVAVRESYRAGRVVSLGLSWRK
ncbi:MAG TPA: TonB-dependent receptor, partial [Longimicrobiales bacterium]|nr:TonB-dependent receptor [Longimicrobiales bacterium]